MALRLRSESRPTVSWPDPCPPLRVNLRVQCRQLPLGSLTMNDPETIIYEVERGRARITLNRPEKLNALSMQLQQELHDALWEADNDTRVHAVIIRANGRAFSAGYD